MYENLASYFISFTEYTAFPRLECARSINFILVLRDGLFEGVLRSKEHSNPQQQSIHLRFHLSAQPFIMACNWDVCNI